MMESEHRINRGNRGFSLVEALVAIAVLSVGVLSLARLVPYATRNDFGSRTDSTGTFIAMRELEQIIAQPWSVTTFTDAGDGNGNTATVNISCTCATAPCTGNAGAPLTGAGTINFSAAGVAQYRRPYTVAAATGNTVKINRAVYDIRWHVTCNVYSKDAGGNVVDGLFIYTVAARTAGSLVPGMLAIPANVQAVRMK